MRFRLTSFHKKSAFSATAHSENSKSGRLSYFIQFFVWFHIVCDSYASDHAHFTFFNLIWPLSLSWVFEIQTNGYTEKLSQLMPENLVGGWKRRQKKVELASFIIARNSFGGKVRKRALCVGGCWNIPNMDILYAAPHFLQTNRNATKTHLFE